MPGTKDAQAPTRWFKKAFGFREESFEETKKQFTFVNDTLSVGSDISFYVGPFDTPSLEDLQARLASSNGAEDASGVAEPLTFHNIKGTSFDLHLDPENAGAVFQVASLFNCLELPGPNASPEDGVTQGGCQPIQGSACASACPAASVFRNYFVNGEGQATEQIDLLSGVAQYVNNRRENYWCMRNGFCMPANNLSKINKRFQDELGFDNDVRGKVRVGVHWDTDVAGGRHRVTQVLCSAAPVAYSKFVKVEDWKPLACCILEAEFEATLAVAACLARQRRERVRVYLTPVGGGVLGNRVKWISDAMDRALTAHKDSPLDVHLVHMSPSVHDAYKKLQDGRWSAQPKVRPTITEEMGRIYGEIDEIERPIIDHSSEEAEHARRIAKTFTFFDLNGDGVIDRREFMDILLMLDSYFFTI
jgi:hypothetical protein